MADENATKSRTQFFNMNIWLTYGIIAVILVISELVYFRIAERCNISDKPNERSSHLMIVCRGGGIIFTIGLWVWYLWFMVKGEWSMVNDYWPLMAGVTLVAAVSFWDDVRSLPVSVRLVAQFVAAGLILFSFMFHVSCFMDLAWYWQALIGIVALVVCVGAADVYNFMDGINGMTAGYSLAVLIPLLVESLKFKVECGAGFASESLIVVMILAVLVFSFFNFRPKGKAKCFAGDVGSVGMAYVLLFLVACLVVKTGDVTWLVFLLVYGVDGCCTIVHRLMLHENLGEAHRKHAYQILTNEVTEWAFGPKQPSGGRFWRRLLDKAENSHVMVSLLYMMLQLVISLGFIYLCPDTVLAHWVYLAVAAAVLCVVYVLFMRKYYHLHEEYLVKLKS